MIGRSIGSRLTDCIALVGLLILSITPSVSIAQSTEVMTPRSEWEALKILYDSTGGPNWTQQSNWDVTLVSAPPLDSISTWHGLRTADGHVTEIDLSNNGLTGTLPRELGQFTKLRVLDLQENNLSGSIGPWIQSLTSLVKLRLQQNRLSGALPDEIGNLVNLEYLNLRSNQLEGSIPESLGRLTPLKGIWLHYNNLSGSIDEGITNLPHLGILWLGHNPGFSGVLTLSSTPLRPSMDINVEGTNLCIDAAADEHNLLGLQKVHSEYACLPSGELSALQSLYQSTNGAEWINNRGWTFDLHPRAVDVGEWFGIDIRDGSVRSLNLERNHLSGHLLPQLGSLHQLEALHLDGNPLHDTLPAELTQLNNLKVFSVSKTQLCAPDLDSVGQWLGQIPTTTGIVSCNTLSESPSPLSSSDQSIALPLWIVAALLLLGIIGAGAILVVVIMGMRRSGQPEPKEPDASQDSDRLGVIEQRIDYLIQSAHSINELAEKSLQQSEVTRDFSSSIKSLRDALDDRDQQIKRLHEGYDNTIYRKFVARFIRVNQAVEYFLQESNDPSSPLESIQSLLDDALLECNVQSFTPEVGSDYRTAFGVSDYPKIIDTMIEEHDCHIAEVLEPGYYIEGGREKEVVIPARVAIYRFQLKHSLHEFSDRN